MKSLMVCTMTFLAGIGLIGVVAYGLGYRVSLPNQPTVACESIDATKTGFDKYTVSITGSSALGVELTDYTYLVVDSEDHQVARMDTEPGYAFALKGLDPGRYSVYGYVYGEDGTSDNCRTSLTVGVSA